MRAKPYRLETLALHAGQTPDGTWSRGIPVYRASSHVFKNTEHAANLFALKELGPIHCWIMVLREFFASRGLPQPAGTGDDKVN
jgi:O-acetylhomoserine (thiol)-lyase